jgi:hypothetical protein
MEAGLIIDVSVEKPGEEKDLIPFPGLIEFIEKRIYFTVTDERRQTITIGINLDDLLVPMKRAFFDKGAD